MRDITELMNAYRECSRNLWNVYFAKRENIGGSLDAFGELRELLFDSLVVSELSYEGDAEAEDIPRPVLKVVPRESSLILIKRLTGPGEAGYWDQEKDLAVGPEDITLFHENAGSCQVNSDFDFVFAFLRFTFLPSREILQSRPERSRARLGLGAAERTLEGEDGSASLALGRKVNLLNLPFVSGISACTL